jgi:uncharacterized membrane protein
MSKIAPGQSANTITGITTSQFTVANTLTSNRPTRWQTLLPGAANYEAFSAVGHCLFAVLAGLLGMVIARRYQKRQERTLETDAVVAA